MIQTISQPLLAATDLRKTYPSSRNALGIVNKRTVIVDDVSFDLAEGETLAVVGESGAGKSTVGRMTLRLVEPDSGSVHFRGEPVSGLTRKLLRDWRSEAQMVFQDPFSSFDPKMTVGAGVGEPLRVLQGVTGLDLRTHVAGLLDRVGIPSSYMDRFPAEFSGGQLQRMSIARALSTQPRLVVCDEPVAALDMSIQSQVISLFRQKQVETGVAYLFISHDLSLVRLIADRVLVMYAGRIVESGSAAETFQNPKHPYTWNLIRSIPVPHPRVQRGRASMPAPPPSQRGSLSGCAFASRCPAAMEICWSVKPEEQWVDESKVACHLYQ